MKIYDKEMYKKEQTIRSAIIVIVTFMLGFLTGYFTMNFEKQYNKEKQENEINVVEQVNEVVDE